MLRIENFTKAYTPGKPAVKDLTLTIENGDIFGFIGHNGAGKTTTIKAITGILPAFEQGEITLDGISIRKDPIAFKKQIAYLPDNPDLYESMTGFKYINFIADIYRVDEKRKQQNVQKYADAFELTAEWATPISAYSHGMKQKAGHHRRARPRAEADDPRRAVRRSGPKAAHTLKGFMKELCANGGSIFFSTHVLEVAEKLCTKIAIIKKRRAHPLRRAGRGARRQLAGGAVPRTDRVTAESGRAACTDVLRAKPSLPRQIL